jgi:hypothetical protein
MRVSTWQSNNHQLYFPGCRLRLVQKSIEHGIYVRDPG